MSMGSLLGKRGEQTARKYLQNHGYTIIGANVRVQGGELDIVAEKGGLLTFFEVKTRSSDQKGKPYEAVDRQKQRKLLHAAEQYCLQFNKKDFKLSLGIISILFDETSNESSISIYDYFI